MTGVSECVSGKVFSEESSMCLLGFIGKGSPQQDGQSSMCKPVSFNQPLPQKTQEGRGRGHDTPLLEQGILPLPLGVRASGCSPFRISSLHSGILGPISFLPGLVISTLISWISNLDPATFSPSLGLLHYR